MSSYQSCTSCLINHHLGKPSLHNCIWLRSTFWSLPYTLAKSCSPFLQEHGLRGDWAYFAMARKYMRQPNLGLISLIRTHGLWSYILIAYMHAVTIIYFCEHNKFRIKELIGAWSPHMHESFVEHENVFDAQLLILSSVKPSFERMEKL